MSTLLAFSFFLPSFTPSASLDPTQPGRRLFGPREETVTPAPLLELHLPPLPFLPATSSVATPPSCLSPPTAQTELSLLPRPPSRPSRSRQLPQSNTAKYNTISVRFRVLDSSFELVNARVGCLERAWERVGCAWNWSADRASSLSRRKLSRNSPPISRSGLCTSTRRSQCHHKGTLCPPRLRES